MNTHHRTWSVIMLIGLIVMATGCAAPTATPTATSTMTPPSKFAATLQATTGDATPTPGLSAGGNIGGTGGTGGNTGNTGGTGGSTGSTGGNTGSNGSNNSGSPTEPPPLPSARPYVVKQIETLGGEVISGAVCNLTQPFIVTSATPHVTFVFSFVPQDAGHGKVAYAYSIKSAGESHDAAGTYSLNPVSTDGTLQLSLSVSDHVVFKGFDGNIPNRYKFNLVPSDSTPCPPAP